MIYQCQTTYIHLARIAAVSELRQNRMSSTEGASFCVNTSGANHALYFRADDRSEAATQRIAQERHKLLLTWHRYRNQKPEFGRTIFRVGDFHMNLLAISAIRNEAGLVTGSGGGGGSPTTTTTYEIFLIGANDPIRRRLDMVPNGDRAALMKERDALLEAWIALNGRIPLEEEQASAKAETE